MANDDNTVRKSSQSSTVWKPRHVIAVFGLFGVGFIEMGVIKSFGVLIDDLVINFQSDIGTIGLVIGTYHGIIFFLGPFVTPLLKYLGTWNLAAIAMGGAGCLGASSFSSSLAFFSVAILLSGVCYSFVLLAALNKFYELVPSEGADIAYGFADSGKAIGMICLPILTEFFKEVYGWRGAILLLAGIGSHLSICTILMKGPPSDKCAVEKKPKSNYEEEQTGDDLEPLLFHSSDMETQMRASRKDNEVSDPLMADSQNLQGLRKELDYQSVSRCAGKAQHGEESREYTLVEDNTKSIIMDQRNITGYTFGTSDNDLNVKSYNCHHASTVPDSHNGEATRESCDQLNDGASHICPEILRFISDALGLRLLITKPALISIYLYYLLSGTLTTSWVVFLIPHGVSKGYPLSKAVYLASFGGIGNMIGRIAQGPIIHKRWLSSIDLIIILCLFNASIFLVDPLVNSFAVLGMNAFIGGLTLGAKIALYFVLLKQFIPSDQFSNAIGFTSLFFSIGEPLGGLMAGWLADVLDFDMAFMVLGAIELGLCGLLIPSRYFLTREDDHEE